VSVLKTDCNPFARTRQTLDCHRPA
jgi:hypothetical protein